MKMIFLEDDVLVRSNYLDYLKKYFTKVYEASSGIEALEILRNEQIDFIIADIQIEGMMNGIEFIKEVRKLNEKVFIVIISAYDNKTYLMEAIKLGLFDYLVKPISRSSFENMISNILNKLKVNDKILLKNDYIWNKRDSKLFLDNDEIKLTKNEAILFEEFCSNNNKVFTFEEISESIYPLEEYNENKIRMLIKRLKKKLNYLDTLENIHNIGYKFNKKEK